MDFSEIMKNVQSMGERMRAQQDELKGKTVEFSAGGGMVVARMNGTGELTGLVIEKTAIDPEDPEMLADLVLAAVNGARKKVAALKADGLRDMTGGIDPSQFGISLDGLL